MAKVSKAVKEQILLPEPVFTGMIAVDDPRFPDISGPDYKQDDRHRSGKGVADLLPIIAATEQSLMLERLRRLILSKNGDGYRFVAGHNRYMALQQLHARAGNKPTVERVTKHVPGTDQVVTFSIPKDYGTVPVVIYEGLNRAQEQALASGDNLGNEANNKADFWHALEVFAFEPGQPISEEAWVAHLANGGSPMSGIRKYFPDAREAEKPTLARPSSNTEHTQTPTRVAKLPRFVVKAVIAHWSQEEGGVNVTKSPSVDLLALWTADCKKAIDLHKEMSPEEIEATCLAAGFESTFIPHWNMLKLKRQKGRGEGAGRKSAKELGEISEFAGVVPELRAWTEYLRGGAGFGGEGLINVLLAFFKASMESFKKHEQKEYDRLHGAVVANINLEKARLKSEKGDEPETNGDE